MVFDNVNNGESLTGTGSTPDTFIGDGYNLAPGTVDLTSFVLYPVNFTTSTTFTNIQETVYVYGAVNNTGTVSATTPAFSNLLGSFTATIAGSFGINSYFPTTLTPTVPLVLPVGTTQIGLSFSDQGSTDGGVTYALTQGLTTIISDTTTPLVGSDVFNGYYRNVNSETNGNFTAGIRSLGLTNQSAAVVINGDIVAVPEPASTAVLAIGGAGILVRRRRGRPGQSN